ncbi:MAG: hypothetical protein H6747_16095 [Deltaproteobacteria bacterium]|nr:hypothetical protein [Deltaproteobacteria bacterium]
MRRRTSAPALLLVACLPIAAGACSDREAAAVDAHAVDTAWADAAWADSAWVDTTAADAIPTDADAAAPASAGLLPPSWLQSCAADPPDAVVLPLRWNRFYAGETPARVSRGLLWVLHWLGATLPAGCEAEVVRWTDERTLILDTRTAGLPPRARCVMQHLGEALLGSEEAAVRGAVDVGRFVALLIGEPAHYYAAVGMPTTFAAFRALHPALGERFAVLSASLVSLGPRRLETSAATPVDGPAWLAAGVHDPPWHAGAEAEWEAFDTLPNGALRYGIYGPDGGLAAMADPDESTAGKPSRCLWCHEGLVTPLILPNPPFALAGAMDAAAVQARVDLDNAWLRGLWHSDPRAIHPEVRDEHSQGELLYAGFLEPSVTRLVSEWGITRQEVQARLQGLPTHHEDVFHVDDEPVYDRRDVDPRAPFGVVPAPVSIHFAFEAEAASRW